MATLLRRQMEDTMFFMTTATRIYGIQLRDLLDLKGKQPKGWRSLRLPFEFSLPLPDINRTKSNAIQLPPHHFIKDLKLYLAIRQKKKRLLERSIYDQPLCIVFRFNPIIKIFSVDSSIPPIPAPCNPVWLGNISGDGDNTGEVCFLEPVEGFWGLRSDRWESLCHPSWVNIDLSSLKPFVSQGRLFLSLHPFKLEPAFLYSFIPRFGRCIDEKTTLPSYRTNLFPKVKALDEDLPSCPTMILSEEGRYYFPNLYMAVPGLSPVGVHCSVDPYMSKVIIAAMTETNCGTHWQLLDECFEGLHFSSLCCNLSSAGNIYKHSLADLGEGIVCALVVGDPAKEEKGKRKRKEEKLVFISVFSLTKAENFDIATATVSPQHKQKFLNVVVHVKRVFTTEYDVEDDFSGFLRVQAKESPGEPSDFKLKMNILWTFTVSYEKCSLLLICLVLFSFLLFFFVRPCYFYVSFE